MLSMVDKEWIWLPQTEMTFAIDNIAVQRKTLAHNRRAPDAGLLRPLVLKSSHGKSTNVQNIEVRQDISEK
jgi:hypothetical protein